jgi:catechol 2,3-dioxygenase-like lactoylglutathione lyase family enzyme
MDVPGLEQGPVWQRPGQVALGAELEIGTVARALVVSSAVGIEFSPHRVPVALHVDDVGARWAELEAKGAECLCETIDGGVCHQALFRDPDGNLLDLHHR